MRLITVVLVTAVLVAEVAVVGRGGRSTTAVRAFEGAAAGGVLCWMKASESGVISRSTGRLLFRKGTRHGCGEELSSWYNLLVKSSGSIFASSRLLTSSLTLAVVSDDCFPLDASLISVDKKFLHFFTFSSVSAETGVGVTGVVVVAPRGPALCVTAVAADPGCTVVGVPSGCPGVVAVPPSMIVFCSTGGLCSTVVAVTVLWTVEPCLIMVVGVTGRASSDAPGVCREVIWTGGVLVGAAGRGVMALWDCD